MICARIQGHGHLTNATTWKATDHFKTFYFKLQIKYSIKLAYRNCHYRMICYSFHQTQPCKPPNAQPYAPFIRYKTTMFANFCILNPFFQKRSQMEQQQSNLGFKKKIPLKIINLRILDISLQQQKNQIKIYSDTNVPIFGKRIC